MNHQTARPPVARATRRAARSVQRGGFFVGLVIGLLIGLGLALGVALYVTKVPVPFINKVPQRTAGQDAAETERNRNWDPNAPLYGKNPARAASAAGNATTPEAAAPTAAAGPQRASAPAGRASAPVLAERASSPRGGASAAGADAFTYFVQAGAFGTTGDAEQQRAKLALLGMEAKLTEREQAGKTVYRVRVGPFDRKGDADDAKEKLAGAGVEAALVRVQRP